MRYDEMREHVREHFGSLLQKFQEQCAENGPVAGLELDALRASQGLAEGDAEGWASLSYTNGSDGLIQAFCEARDIVPEPEGRGRALLISELQKGYLQYVSHALKHTAEFDTLEVNRVVQPAPPRAASKQNDSNSGGDALPFTDVQSRYFDELDRTNALAPKTDGEKRCLGTHGRIDGALAARSYDQGTCTECESCALQAAKEPQQEPQDQRFTVE